MNPNEGLPSSPVWRRTAVVESDRVASRLVKEGAHTRRRSKEDAMAVDVGGIKRRSMRNWRRVSTVAGITISNLLPREVAPNPKMTKTRRSDPDIALIFWFLRPSSHPKQLVLLRFSSFTCPSDDQFTFANRRHFAIHNVCPSSGRAPCTSCISTGSFLRVTHPATLCGDLQCSSGSEAPGPGR